MCVMCVTVCLSFDQYSSLPFFPFFPSALDLFWGGEIFLPPWDFVAKHLWSDPGGSACALLLVLSLYCSYTFGRRLELFALIIIARNVHARRTRRSICLLSIAAVMVSALGDDIIVHLLLLMLAAGIRVGIAPHRSRVGARAARRLHVHGGLVVGAGRIALVHVAGAKAFCIVVVAVQFNPFLAARAVGPFGVHAVFVPHGHCY